MVVGYKMDMQKIFSLQKNFDQSCFPCFVGGNSKEDTLQLAIFLVLGALGELGEFANVVKKIYRGDCTLDQSHSELEGEIADVFIYVIKICQTLEIDLEEAFLEKLKKNEYRFKPSK